MLADILIVFLIQFTNLGEIRARISPNAKEVSHPSTKPDVLAPEPLEEIVVMYTIRFNLCELVFFIHIDCEKDESRISDTASRLATASSIRRSVQI